MGKRLKKSWNEMVRARGHGRLPGSGVRAPRDVQSYVIFSKTAPCRSYFLRGGSGMGAAAKYGAGLSRQHGLSRDRAG